MDIKTINVRIYGICIVDGKILTLKEEYYNEKFIKLPGGGLELGEGLKDTLKREFLEELNAEIENIEHFYTQEDFLVSKLKSDEQILTIYFLVKIKNLNEITIKDKTHIKEIIWQPINGTNPFNLPIDQKVFEKLKKTAE